MKKQLRIALYSGDIPSTTFIERLVDGISTAGHSVLLFGLLKSKVRYRSKVRVIGYYNIKISKLWHLIYYSTLLFIFKNSQKQKLDDYLRRKKKYELYSKVKYYPVLWYQPDIFHIQWAKALSDWIWVKDFGIKLVLSLRGAHINYSPIADKALADNYIRYFQDVDGFHAVSKAIVTEATKYGADTKKIEVIYSGLNINDFTYQCPAVNKTLRLLSVGRSHWIKGYHYALDACKLLKEVGISFEYCIIGAAGSIELAYQINDLELEKEVKLLPKQTFQEIKMAIRNSDILVLSSVEEGIANVVLEAMALGTLVVSTDCGGMAEVINHGENGLLVAIRDAESMASAFQNVYKMREEERIQISKNARWTIERRHNQDKMTAQMINLYKKVLTN